jgi:hypothetical protein
VYSLSWRLLLAVLVAFGNLQFSQIRGRQPYSIVRNILYVIPLAARAQQPLPMIGILRINPREFEIFAEPFRRDMKELGWEEGRNVRFEFVWAGGRNEDVPALARDLVARQPDMIVTFGKSGALGSPTRHDDDPDRRDDR